MFWSQLAINDLATVRWLVCIWVYLHSCLLHLICGWLLLFMSRRQRWWSHSVLLWQTTDHISSSISSFNCNHGLILCSVSLPSNFFPLVLLLTVTTNCSLCQPPCSNFQRPLQPWKYALKRFFTAKRKSYRNLNTLNNLSRTYSTLLPYSVLHYKYNRFVHDYSMAVPKNFSVSQCLTWSFYLNEIKIKVWLVIFPVITHATAAWNSNFHLAVHQWSCG